MKLVKDSVEVITNTVSLGAGLGLTETSTGLPQIISSGVGTFSLSDASDVSLSSPSSGQYFYFNGSSWTNHNIIAGDVLSGTFGGSNYSFVNSLSVGGSLTMTGGKIITFTPTTSSAGLNLPHGTAPSSPVNGDLWTTTTGLFARINGNTRQYVNLNQAQTISGVKTFSVQQAFTVASGTSPFTTVSSTVVTSLNADLLDGADGSYYLALANSSGNLPWANLPVGSSSWDTGAGTTTTITRSLTISGTLTVSSSIDLTGASVTGAPTWGSTQTLNTSGNAGTATALQTGRTISITGDLSYSSSSFDGTGNVTGTGTLATVATAGTTGSSTAIPVITIDAKGRTTSITTAAVIAPAGTLTGTTLASNVVSSSLTSVGTLTGLTVSGTINATGTGTGLAVTNNATVGGTLLVSSSSGISLGASGDAGGASITSLRNLTVGSQIGWILKSTIAGSATAQLEGRFQDVRVLVPLSAAGAVSMESTLDVTGNTSLAGTLGVTGVITGSSTADSSVVLSGGVLITRGSGGMGYRSRVTADTADRFRTQVQGVMEWGDGSSAVDTNLYRSGADLLRTDDSFSVGTNLTVAGGTTAVQALTATTGIFSGAVRIANNTNLNWRNAAGSADIKALVIDSSDRTVLNATTSSTIAFQIAQVDKYLMTNADFSPASASGSTLGGVNRWGAFTVRSINASSSISTTGNQVVVGSGVTTANQSASLILNAGTDGGANNKLNAVEWQLGGTILWRAGVLGSLTADTHWRLRDNVNSATAIDITPGANPAVAFNGAVSGITTLTATTLAGTLSTAAQPNITSVGTLTSLSVGAITSTGALTVTTTTTPQAKFAYDASDYVTVSVSSLGLVTFDAVGSGSAFRFNDGMKIYNGSSESFGVTIGGTDVQYSIDTAGSQTQQAGIFAAIVGGSGYSHVALGVEGRIVARPTTGNTLATAFGVEGFIYLNDSGTITTARTHTGTMLADSGGVITTAQIYFAGNPALSGGSTITTLVGLDIQNMTSGATNYAIRTGTGTVSLGDGVVLGSATGGNKGVGTINIAGDIYKNNTAYTNPDYVFDVAFSQDRSRAPTTYELMSLDNIYRYVKVHHHLPGLDRDPKGLFDRQDYLLEKTEEIHLHLFDHEDRLKRLESKLKYLE